MKLSRGALGRSIREILIFYAIKNARGDIRHFPARLLVSERKSIESRGTKCGGSRMRLEDPRCPTGVSPIQVVSYQLILKSTSDELVYAMTFATCSILSLHASCNEPYPYYCLTLITSSSYVGYKYRVRQNILPSGSFERYRKWNNYSRNISDVCFLAVVVVLI